MPHRVESLLRALIVAGAVFAPLAAIAQTAGVPVRSSTGAAAFVNGAVISNYDLDQRTALGVVLVVVAEEARRADLLPTEKNGKKTPRTFRGKGTAAALSAGKG